LPTTILLWGLPADAPVAAVRDALQRASCQVTLLDQRAVLDTEIELTIGSSVEGLLRVRDETFDLAAVKALYLRPYDSRELPNVASAGQDSGLWRHARAVQDVLLSWAVLTSALALNRPSAMEANSSKPYQASWVESLGFRIPDICCAGSPWCECRSENCIIRSQEAVPDPTSDKSSQDRAVPYPSHRSLSMRQTPSRKK
jgi:hypothetical protein